MNKEKFFNLIEHSKLLHKNKKDELAPIEEEIEKITEKHKVLINESYAEIKKELLEMYDSRFPSGVVITLDDLPDFLWFRHYMDRYSIREKPSAAFEGLMKSLLCEYIYMSIGTYSVPEHLPTQTVRIPALSLTIPSDPIPSDIFLNLVKLSTHLRYEGSPCMFEILHGGDGYYTLSINSVDDAEIIGKGRYTLEKGSLYDMLVYISKNFPYNQNRP